MSAIPLAAVTRSWSTEQRPATSSTIRGLKGIRWAVRATLILGVAASVAANVLHALPHLISQLIAAWPPIALLLTVELISRVPVHRKLLAAARLLATTAIAGIAAWVSYWHMVGVAGRYGETGLSAYLLPISVDGLIVVASISLVELSARLQVAQSTPAAPHPAPPAGSMGPGDGSAATSSPGNPPNTPESAAPPDEPAVDGRASADPAGDSPGDQPEPSMGDERQTHNGADGNTPSPNADGVDTDDDPHRDDSNREDDGNGDGDQGGDPRQRRRRGNTREAVLNAYRADPTQHPTAIAETVGTSERTVRRYLDEYRAGPGNDSRRNSNGAAHAHNGSRR
jgi:Protein of unknown function (DUF2637)